MSYKYRVHDARLGRFLSIDPLAPEYPWNSPYAFSENKVIRFIELEGLETADPQLFEYEVMNGIGEALLSFFSFGNESSERKKSQGSGGRSWLTTAKANLVFAWDNDMKKFRGGIMFTSAKPYTGDEDNRTTTGQVAIVNIDVLLDAIEMSKAAADAPQIRASYEQLQKAYTEFENSKVAVGSMTRYAGADILAEQIYTFEQTIMKYTKQLGIPGNELITMAKSPGDFFDAGTKLVQASKEISQWSSHPTGLPSEDTLTPPAKVGGDTSIFTDPTGTYWQWRTTDDNSGWHAFPSNNENLDGE